jgi:two-component system, chemotaxis family, chemotaxis protein CheY
VSRLRILVCDDDLDKRHLLVRGIAEQFPTSSVFECDDGEEALEYFTSNRVDVVVTDHSMRPVNGVEMVRMIRESGAKTPIIMVSGDPAIRGLAELAGVNLFLGSENLLRVGKEIRDLLCRHGFVGQE